VIVSQSDGWSCFGRAWAHAYGNGFNIQLETDPLDGRVASEKTK
jgi:hypothetical protein